MYNISVIGTGYVGLVTGACLADFGHKVICMDSNSQKIKELKDGNIPIYEPGLFEVVERNVLYQRLSFTDDISYAVKNSDVIFIAVGTPQGDDDRADMSQYICCINDIANNLDGSKIVVNKSTVPVGTGRKAQDFFDEKANGDESKKVRVVSNPEFLREGSAVYDFTHQDRVVLGGDSHEAIGVLKEIYRVLYLNETPFITTNFETAELIKYSTNSFLAMKISFINEIANLCDKVGANVQVVAKALGQDGRISPKFLHAGAGYGGSCFPKDTRALVAIGEDYNSSLNIIKTVIYTNERQKALMAEKILHEYEDIKDKKICILGLTFKPNTDDIRESPSITIIKRLIDEGAKISATDPEGIENFKSFFKGTNYENDIEFFKDEYEAIDGSYGIVIATQWNQYRMLDFNRISKVVNRKILFDLRNIYRRDDIENQGYEYIGVGQ